MTGAHLAYALAMKLRRQRGKELCKAMAEEDEDIQPCVMYCGPSQQSVNVVLGEFWHCRVTQSASWLVAMNSQYAHAR